MSDRELLELAAKAVGIDKYWTHYEASNSSLLIPTEEGEYADEWNPLTDDGDALRLAVKLGLDISFDLKTQIAYCEECMEPAQRNGGDMEKAARRAIVRAAAEIGRAMP